MSRVDEIGEFALIARLARRLPSYGQDLVEGIGDDVAVLKTESDRLLLLTCDIQVSGVHFLPGVISPHQLGRKIAAINLSDIGAKGGRPLHFLFSLGVPGDTEVEDLESLYDGVRQECEPFGVDVVGGNMSRAPVLLVDAFLMGEVNKDHLLRRKGAEVQDLVLVTGALGASRAGLEILLKDLAKGLPEAVVQAALSSHLTPRPRVREGQTIAELGGVTAMLDVSDGLAADLGHICDASRVGVRVWAEKVPVAPSAEEIAPVVGADALSWALGGGEDYELCFTAKRDQADRIVNELQARTGTPVRIIGEILPEEAGRRLLLGDGSETELTLRGWDHFRGSRAC